jgi:Ca2+/Na+ antiporter
LACGNGSPDVFASITSFTGGQDVLIGVGALLGASMFVATVVVGSVTIIAPCKVVPSIFIRDISFYLGAISMVTYISVTSKVTFTNAMCFLALYAIYVGVVIVGWWLGGDNSSGDAGGASTNKERSFGGVQAAYWHAPTSTQKYTKLLNKDRDAAAAASSESSYSFLILGDPSHRKKLEYKEEEDYLGGENSDEEEFTVNLSGGLITPQFDHEIVEDYFQQKKQINDSQPTSFPPNARIAPFDGIEMGLGAGPAVGGDGDLASPLLAESPVAAARRIAAKQKRSMFMSSLYWQQWQLRRHMHKRLLTAEWWDYTWPMKILAVFETPLNVIRDLTVPTIDDELWYKPYSVLQPLCAPLLMIFTFGAWHSHVGGMISAPLVGAFVGLPLALFVFLTTHHSHPPAGSVYSVSWVLVAFAMCVTWIYLFAGELVACLQAIGMISGIPPGVLGLTILAWGNSVGDLFANMAVAKQGLGEMAIAGSYGGPVFNLCLGLGISLSYVCTSTYPEPFELKLDESSIVSLVFIYIAIISTISVTIFSKFEMTSYLGYSLISLYALYTITQLCVLIFG